MRTTPEQRGRSGVVNCIADFLYTAISFCGSPFTRLLAALLCDGLVGTGEVEVEGQRFARLGTAPGLRPPVVDAHHDVDDHCIARVPFPDLLDGAPDILLFVELYVAGEGGFVEGALHLEVPEDLEMHHGLDRVLASDNLLRGDDFSVFALRVLHVEDMGAPWTRSDPLHALRERLREMHAELSCSLPSAPVSFRVLADIDELEEPGMFPDKAPKIVQAHVAPPAV